jgi:hypothetical protein
MRSITRLFGAFGTLADSLLALASVVNTAKDKLRLQLAVEHETPALPPAGEVIDAEADTPTSNGTRKRKAKANA